MHITILTIGSRGDVQPYIALGLGLRQAGYDVRLVTHAPFESMIRRYGLGFAPMAGNMQAHHQSKEGKAFLASGRNTLRFVGRMRRQVRQLAHQAIKDCWSACQDTDVIISSVFSSVIGYNIATRLKLPFMQAYTYPVHPTTAFPNPLFPIPFRKSRILNLLTYSLGNLIVWQAIRPYTNAALRQTLNCRPSFLPHLEIHRRQLPVLYGYSPSVLPKPRNWGEWIDVVGYWFLPQEEWSPPTALLDFLAAGPAPVYVGFGSMVNENPAEMAEIVLVALKKTGQRGILLTGWGGLSHKELPDDVFVLEKAPHDWIFPRMSAVVHHGGAGTTAAALRAGVPSIIIPFFLDQPIWGERNFDLGVGPRPIPRQKLSVEQLANAINQTVNNPTMQAKAATLSKRVRTEKGVERAVEIITAYLKGSRE